MSISKKWQNKIMSTKYKTAHYCTMCVDKIAIIYMYKMNLIYCILNFDQYYL